MRLSYDADTEAFRAELRAWIEANRPAPDEMTGEPRQSSAHLPTWARAWQRRLFDAGWLVPGWPPELGGRNATPVQQMVYFEEFAQVDLARSYSPQGLGIVVPSIIDYGDDEQRERFALPTLRGEITWCVGMSEPNAGSDLAGLSTRAEDEGDHFLVNGQKVWTSGAHHADWCWCFVRTDPTVPKHAGISVLIIDMKTAGITCRPLPELTDPDYADFNEVFFTDVVVPKQNLVGELNRGWPMAVGSLQHERGMIWIMNYVGVSAGLESLRKLADEPALGGGRIGDDPRFRDDFARLYIDAEAIKFLGYKGFARFARGENPPEHTILKLFGSEVERRLNQVGMEAMGPRAIDVSMDVGGARYRDGAWAYRYLRSFAHTIAGGTSEIQRNIIAERVLGLPRR